MKIILRRITSYFQKRKRQFDFRNPKILSTTASNKTVTFKTAYIWLIVLILAIGLLIWWLFYGDFFKIKNIEIAGTLNDTIKKEIDGFKGKNIFLFTIGQKDKELAKAQSSVEKLDIIKGIPDTLKVDVLVRKPAIRWKSKNVDYFIDNDGTVFSLDNPTDDDKSKPLVIDNKNISVILGSKMVTNSFIDFVEKVSSEFSTKVGKDIAEIKVNDTTLDLEIKLKDSYTIYLSTLNDLDDQLYLLSKVIGSHDSEIKEYVDLRVTNRAYYK